MTATLSLLAELRRRNVYRAAVLYGAGAWLLVQIATQVFPFFHKSIHELPPRISLSPHAASTNASKQPMG